MAISQPERNKRVGVEKVLPIARLAGTAMPERRFHEHAVKEYKNANLTREFRAFSDRPCHRAL
ncbi:hypothetical protein MesoLj131a_56260 [Mesorhizobium sp. 131-2-1]|nr:hypothetical protein MesoLj131a_56260 [Mesorhizobium sp. 131-2-1]